MDALRLRQVFVAGKFRTIIEFFTRLKIFREKTNIAKSVIDMREAGFRVMILTEPIGEKMSERCAKNARPFYAALPIPVTCADNDEFIPIKL